jgi:hypothetical protein
LASGTADIVCIFLHDDRLLPLSFLHGSELSLVPITDRSRRRPALLKFVRSVHVSLLFLLVDQGQVLVSHDLLLVFFDLVLLGVDLVSAPDVLSNDLFVIQDCILPLMVLRDVPLGDQLLGSFTEHALLLTMVVELLLVLHSFLSNCSEHEIALA